MPTHPQAPPATPPASPLPTLIVICLAVFFSVLNGTMVNVALPVIGRDLGIEAARLGWVVTGYLLVFGVSVPFFGRLADKFGARRIFVLGLAVFALSSLLLAVSSSYSMLMAARLAQAAGAAAVPGLGMALVSRAYPPEKRGSAMGFVSMTVGTGAAIGPTLGGTIASAFGWNGIFLLTALSGLLIPLALRVLPPAKGTANEGLDLGGGVLLALSIAGALLAATEGSRGDPGSPFVLGALALSLVAAVLLVVRQRTAAYPFIPRDLLRNRRFLLLVATSFCSMAANLSVLIAIPLMLTAFNRLSPVQVGLVLLPEAIAFTLLAPVSGRLVDRIGPRMPILFGLALMAVALLGLSSLGAGATPGVVGALVVLLSSGFAFVNSPLATTVSLVIGRDRLSSGLSINSMAFFLGGSFGTALLSAVLTARRGAQSALNPAYSGQLPAYSDAFLALVLPVLGAMALSFALPASEPNAQEAQPAPSATPAASGVRR